MEGLKKDYGNCTAEGCICQDYTGANEPLVCECGHGRFVHKVRFVMDMEGKIISHANSEGILVPVAASTEAKTPTGPSIGRGRGLVVPSGSQLALPTATAPAHAADAPKTPFLFNPPKPKASSTSKEQKKQKERMEHKEHKEKQETEAEQEGGAQKKPKRTHRKESSASSRDPMSLLDTEDEGEPRGSIAATAESMESTTSSSAMFTSYPPKVPLPPRVFIEEEDESKRRLKAIYKGCENYGEASGGTDEHRPPTLKINGQPFLVEDESQELKNAASYCHTCRRQLMRDNAAVCSMCHRYTFVSCGGNSYDNKHWCCNCLAFVAARAEAEQPYSPSEENLYD